MAEEEFKIASFLYGPSIHGAARLGDLAKMKKLAEEAEAFLKSQDQLNADLEILKAEISKKEDEP